ncbi:MAG TPA: hypothetical protein QF641_01200 [Candidatus Thalassarchaeaceae archaeon]|nr:hypothetical protein [Candidatus Thalassarchaeaceae archaeon]|tara:strand:+ start:4921 stop:8457 length:3537 start_codon:yes stop_codon:yes gene_type:complete
MLMGTFRALLLSSLLIAVGFSSAPVHFSEDPQETALVSPRNNPVDFEVTGIEVGNNTLSPKTWVQPDSSIMEYMTKSETIQINVTFFQGGVDPSPITADAKLEIWHPIGIIIQEWTFNITLAAGQSVRVPFIWTPSIAHSTLSDDGWLSGGVTFRGTVFAGIGIDGDDTNDLLDRDVPVALWYDPMENGFCNDEAFEGKYCTNTAVPFGVPTWYAAGYTDGYQADTDFPTGTWRMENVSSATGEWHWKVSGANDNYASNRFDRLRWAWQRINSQDGCSDGVWGNGYSHGLGYGEYDSTVSSIHGANLCMVKLNSPLLYSVQIATDAWGQMADGDTIMLETDSGSAGSTEYLNYTSINLSSTEGDWTRLVWNATGLHQNEGFTTSFLFRSDSSFADEGIHLDSFIIFAIERGEEYTLDARCTFPDNFGGTMEYDPESEGGNTILVEAADPDPPSLHCHIFNRGYVDTTLWYYTEVSNWSWMSSYPLRIDSNNPNFDHDNFVKSGVVKARTYTDTWFNLSIPDGAPVQDLNWYTWINDGIVNKSGDGSGIKYYVELPVSVQSTYRMTLKQKTLANPAATIMPGGKAMITMDLKNTGNQYSSWNMGGIFPDIRLTAADNLKWYDTDGAEVTVLNLTPVEEITLNAEISIPEGLDPGLYELDLLANPRMPNTFQASSKVYIEVPVYHELAIAPVRNAMMAPANGEQNIVQVFLFNYGNTEETFDVRVVTTNWKLLADISSHTVTLEANGGQTTLSLILPMPMGVENGTYQVSIIATSQSDQSFQSMSNFYLTVPKTYLVSVSDRDLSDEVFAAGTDPRTLKWEIWNNGNQDDAYDVELDFPSDVTARVEGRTSFRTPYIPAGSSYNLSVSYSFDAGVDGARIIKLQATSTESGVSSEGEARFDVGTVGYLLVLPPSSSSNAIEIYEPGDDYIIVLPIRSAHPELDQQIRTEVELEDLWTIYDARVAEEDRDFVLQAGESRNVTIHLELRDEHLEALIANSVDFNITLVIISDLDTTSKTTTITLFKPDPVPEGPDVENLAWRGTNYLLIAVGVAIMCAVLLAAFRIFKDARAPLEEFSSLGDYRMTVDGWDGAKSAEGTLPSADEIANSMYGGSQELFEQPPPDIQSVPLDDDSRPSSTTSTPPPNPDETSSPPIPDSGIPEGWTMEQWQHYGQQWLDSQKE